MKMKSASKKYKIRVEGLIEFCDLSSGLDQELTLIASLLRAARENGNVPLPDLGDCLVNYLDRRRILESVFFNRYLGPVNLEPLKLSAELSRIKKIFARYSS